MSNCQCLTELFAQDTTVFLFLDNNFSKYQWIFTKFGIMEIWFIATMLWRFGLVLQYYYYSNMN